MVGWFVSSITQKTTEQISVALGWRMGLASEENPLTLTADPDKVTDPESFFSLSLTFRDGVLFNIYIDFSVNNVSPLTHTCLTYLHTDEL